MRWLVDGMNVIGSRPDAWWKDRDAAMARLVEMLERWSDGGEDEVAVVFEREPRPPIDAAAVAVVHAPRSRPNAADDEIVRRLEADPDPGRVTVVTSDRALADRVRAIGARVEPASAFRELIEAA
jgi:predicted RNA-binding protein with PIN domain